MNEAINECCLHNLFLATTSPQSTIPIPTIAGTVVSAAILTSTIVIIVIIVIIRCPKKRTKVNFPVVYYNST